MRSGGPVHIHRMVNQQGPIGTYCCQNTFPNVEAVLILKGEKGSAILDAETLRVVSQGLIC